MQTHDANPKIVVLNDPLTRVNDARSKGYKKKRSDKTEKIALEQGLHLYPKTTFPRWEPLSLPMTHHRNGEAGEKRVIDQSASH